MQTLYDDKYVDTISVIKAAKANDLDMMAVNDGLVNAGYDQDKLWDWKEDVYEDIGYKNSDYVETDGLRNHAAGLEVWTPELQEEMDGVMDNPRKLKKFESKVLQLIEEGKKKMREMYG